MNMKYSIVNTYWKLAQPLSFPDLSCVTLACAASISLLYTTVNHSSPIWTSTKVHSWPSPSVIKLSIITKRNTLGLRRFFTILDIVLTNIVFVCLIARLLHDLLYACWDVLSSSRANKNIYKHLSTIFTKNSDNVDW